MKRLLAVLCFVAPAFAAQPPDSLSITAYGATGNDASDDTAAINSTISAARTQGKRVYVPEGTFYHKNVILDGVSLIGEGKETSILYGFDASNNTLFVKGSGVTVSHLQFRSASISRTAVDHQIFIDRATNFSINNLIVDGGNSTGIFNYGGSNGKITKNFVKNTLADSIHTTKGAHHIIVADNVVRNSGDDMIAVVGYNLAEQPYNVLIQGNDVADQSWGRGITVVGGKDVTIQNNKIARTTHAAGILVATESAYTSPPVSNVLIRNNELIENSGETGHGAFMVSGSNGLITRVRFENNTITNPVHSSIKLEKSNSNIALINNTMTDPEGKGINISAGTNIYCSGNTMNSAASSNAKCTGTNNFTVTGSSLTYVPSSSCP